LSSLLWQFCSLSELALRFFSFCFKKVGAAAFAKSLRPDKGSSRFEQVRRVFKIAQRTLAQFVIFPSKNGEKREVRLSCASLTVSVISPRNYSKKYQVPDRGCLQKEKE